jgi:phosphomannomutase
MALIKSISGIRGTIGGFEGDNLTPLDIIKFTAAFVSFIKQRSTKDSIKLVIGRDARISGMMVNHIVIGTAMSLGADIIDTGLSTTPTVEIAVPLAMADGGIILTASHNPKQWNALKLLNEKGEFISASEGNLLLEMIAENKFEFNNVDELGQYYEDSSLNDEHIKQVLAMPLVDVEAIRNADFKVALDCVNSSGGILLPELLKELGVTQIEKLYCEPNGNFPHNPEPLPKNLTEISKLMTTAKADVGFVVDPDVDRLAIISEDGSMFGEEYTLVAVADYVLQHQKGNTVSNLSSTRALRDITEKYGGEYFASAVGEVNVVEKMKAVNAIIGGEGNGGIIDPALHYGRDALVGIALFLTHLAKSGLKCSELRKTYPEYYISKNKIELSPELNVDLILENMKEKYKDTPHSTIDGLKIDFEEEWVHLRKSNTEPIIRIYVESKNAEKSDALAEKIMGEIRLVSV